MQPVVFDKPYEFVPPYHGWLWPRILQNFSRRQLRKDYGIERVECVGLDRLKKSLDAGHGIVLAPNHCRPSDPMVISEMCRQAGVPPYTMASWHLFMASRLQTYILRRVGAFSVYREGMDRQALQAAIEILEQAKRPLVIFPEGVITRTNDRMLALMDGLSFIARSAAKKRAKKKDDTDKGDSAGQKGTSDGKVVVHPVAIRYRYHGDINESLHAALDDIENRLSWRPKRDSDLVDRIYRVGQALLWLKEIEYFGSPQTGDMNDRLKRLIDGILTPMEREWLGGEGKDSDQTIVSRVKKLRIAILPDMIEGDLSEQERKRRWDQLADMYLAQQLGHYPPDYIRSNPTTERMLETVEKFEEDLTDECRVYRPMSATVEIGEAIEVSPKRVRGAKEDPVMSALEGQLHQMLGITPAGEDPQGDDTAGDPPSDVGKTAPKDAAPQSAERQVEN